MKMREDLMRLLTLFILVVSAASTLACPFSVPRVLPFTIETQTLEIDEPAPPGTDPVRVTIEMGAGNMSLRGGGAGLIEGSVKYNVADWKPKLSRTDRRLEIRQESRLPSGLPTRNVLNEWSLRLGEVPMQLAISAGAYEGMLDFSGVALTSLEITDGASRARVLFDTLNPQPMTKFYYKTGASSVELIGLANANFSDMEFSCGAGSYTLDFSGELQRDANVRINGGVSNIIVIIPAGTPSEVTISGVVSNVNLSGTWTVSGNTYRTGGEGHRLNIQIEMGIGNLELVQE